MEQKLYITEMLQMQSKFDSFVMKYGDFDYMEALESGNYYKTFMILAGQIVNMELAPLERKFFIDDQFSVDENIAWDALADARSNVLSFYLAVNGGVNWDNEILVWYKEELSTVDWVYTIAEAMEPKNLFVYNRIFSDSRVGETVLGEYISYLVSEDDNFVADVYELFVKRLNRRAVNIASLLLKEFPEDEELFEIQQKGLF